LYNIYLSPPQLSGKEIKALKKVLRSNWLAPHGATSVNFRSSLRQASSSKYIVLTNAGTAAIHLALKVLGVGFGDEVICPTYTFAASAFPILYLHAKPIFIDVKADTWNICPDLMEIAIKDRLRKGKKVKAIILVHNYGNPVDWQNIYNLAEEYGIPIIEDAAEALGAKYDEKNVGGLSALGVYSFNANKIVTSAGGGALMCKSEEHYKQALKLCNQAKEPLQPYYVHHEVGYNYAMSDIQASIGLSQLGIIDKKVTQKRKILTYYQEALKDLDFIDFQKEEKKGCSNRWLSCIKLSMKAPASAMMVKQALKGAKIESRLSWTPLHTQKAFEQSINYTDGTSEMLFNTVLCLPSGTGLTKKEQQLVVKELKKAFA